MRPRRPRRELPPRRFDRYKDKPPVRVHPLLRRANNLFSNGKYIEAAMLYEKLALGAQDRNLPRTPILYLQASKAFLIAEKGDEGMRMLMQGLELFVDQKRWRELLQFGKRSVNVLNELGYSQEAEEIEAWLEERLPEEDKKKAKSTDDQQQKERTLFPVTCPSCGARVHPDEVRVIDESTVECSFCGNLIRKK